MNVLADVGSSLFHDGTSPPKWPSNAAEPLSDGHTIWLFAGSDDGGDRAAAIYTLIGTAKLNDLNPEAYLRYVLERIADHPISKLDELLPWAVLQQLPSLRLAA